MELPEKGEVMPLPRIAEICRFYGLDELWNKIRSDPPLKPFESDGCSLWTDRWNGIDIYPACFRHDLKYWAGRDGEALERLRADCTLMLEVAELTGDLRLGGHESLKQSFSWGFGRR